MRQSSTSIQTYKSCRRLYELKYIHGIEPTQKSEALERGSNYHEKVESILKYGCFTYDLDKSTAMAWAFSKYILPDLKPVASVEEWFEIGTLESGIIIGKVDAKDESGAIIEHKTTSMEIDEAYWYNKQFDEQLMTYMLGNATNRAIYTVCKTPTIRQKQNETEEEFVQRCMDWYDTDTEKKIAWREIVIPMEQLEEHMRMLTAIVKEANECSLFYRNQNYCTHWGRMCEYAPICQHYDPNETYIGFEKKERSK